MDKFINLHSIVVLLKVRYCLCYHHHLSLFTFYCSSIKRLNNCDLTDYKKDLHSIVVLLKVVQNLLVVHISLHLHSIVVLLKVKFLIILMMNSYLYLHSIVVLLKGNGKDNIIRCL